MMFSKHHGRVPLKVGGYYACDMYFISTHDDDMNIVCVIAILILVCVVIVLMLTFIIAIYMCTIIITIAALLTCVSHEDCIEALSKCFRIFNHTNEQTHDVEVSSGVDAALV